MDDMRTWMIAITIGATTKSQHRSPGSIGGRSYDPSRDAAGRAGDIVPYWVYPGHAKIERMVPIRPFSREVERYGNLKKSSATYRLAFGQPRQDDLIELFSTFGSDVVAELADLQISLRPSKIGSFAC